MLRKVASFLKRMELASDALVLENIPHSAHAAKVREKHAENKTTKKSEKELDPDFAVQLASEVAKAAHAIHELAKLGDPEGMFNLGEMHENGFGVDKDLREAVRLYELAALAGYAPAQTRLGNAYFEGDIVAQSETQAFLWYKLGADNGDNICQKNVGIMYLHGVGVEQDSDAALKWFLASASQGNFVAQRNLGEMYLHGNGVDINKGEALKWFTIAERCGDPDALKLWSEIIMDVPAAESRNALKAAEQYSKNVK